VEWNVQNVLLEDVEQIEVVRGLGGTIWGSNVVKGVINIITKNAKDTRGAVTTTSANQGKQQGTSVYSMSSCLWGKCLLQLSKATE
jgi:iron complex outermembrane receptor protein